MRLAPFFFILSAAVLSSCANEGTIVQKQAGPQPFYCSLGVDGSYAFLLRDQTGTTHRQLVTPEVFERYAVGDYFNDFQPAPTHEGKDYSKEMRTGANPPAAALAIARVHRATESHHVASKKKAPARQHLANRKHTPRVQHHKAVARVEHAPAIAAVASAKETEIAFVSITRCR